MESSLGSKVQFAGFRVLGALVYLRRGGQPLRPSRAKSLRANRGALQTRR